MDNVTLKHTNLNVSRICFGAMTFGGQTDEPAAARMLDRCADAGINFLDTANVYNAGASEEMLGRLLAGQRDRFIIASKVRNKMGDGPDMNGLSRAAIHRAIDDSLRRLRMDYLDMYYLHLPDYAAPIEESLDEPRELVLAAFGPGLRERLDQAWVVTAEIREDVPDPGLGQGFE